MAKTYEQEVKVLEDRTRQKIARLQRNFNGFADVPAWYPDEKEKARYDLIQTLITITNQNPGG